MPNAIIIGKNRERRACRRQRRGYAQTIEERAFAKVAMREDTWRRANWLRWACVRKQIG